MIRRIDRNKRYYETVNSQRKMNYDTIAKAREYFDDEWLVDFILEELSDSSLDKVASALDRFMGDI